LEAQVAVPGSKSATARSLILSALAEAPGTITGGLVARDTDLMIQALRSLGVTIDHQPTGGDQPWSITPPAELTSGSMIDCGLAGTVMRFVPPLAALANGPTAFRGDPAASDRPIAPLLSGLSQLGAGVSGQALPFTITGRLTGHLATIDASRSSQFVSGLLLAAARFPQGLELGHAGDPIPSLPHIEMTLEALAARGVVANLVDHPRSPATSCWQVTAGPIQALNEVIEPDLSTAAVFLAAALVAGGSITIPHWPQWTSQPGAATPEILAHFGGHWQFEESGLRLTGDGQLQGADLDLRHNSELTPVVAAVAVLADSPTTIRGVAHIRGHETDRLAALANNITALGGQASQTADGLIIQPARLQAGLWRTFGDHRLAHAGALIGLRYAGIDLDDVTVVSKTMPDFVATWQDLLP